MLDYEIEEFLMIIMLRLLMFFRAFQRHGYFFLELCVTGLALLKLSLLMKPPGKSLASLRPKM